MSTFRPDVSSLTLQFQFFMSHLESLILHCFSKPFERSLKVLQVFSPGLLLRFSKLSSKCCFFLQESQRSNLLVCDSSFDISLCKSQSLGAWRATGGPTLLRTMQSTSFWWRSLSPCYFLMMLCYEVLKLLIKSLDMRTEIKQGWRFL